MFRDGNMGSYLPAPSSRHRFRRDGRHASILSWPYVTSRPGQSRSKRKEQLTRWSSSELADYFFLSLQLFISLIVPLVVATLNSLPPPPTVPESSFEWALPCTVIGKSA